MKALEKVIKDAVAANGYKSGVKEVLQSVKGTQLIIVSKSIDLDDRARLEEQTKTANVPVYEYPGTSEQLGKLCHKPSRLTAIAISSGNAAELDVKMSHKRSAA